MRATATKPSFAYEDRHQGPVCGIDEVGRGPLAGPVVAAAVIIDRDRFPPAALAEINDSKKLTAPKRAVLAATIRDYAHVALAECSVAEIDDINILQASMQAMAKACAALSLRPSAALVDGNRKPKLACTVQTIVKGDSLSLSIAAASIVAKQYRDALMARLAEEFPNYGWERNAGYGTAAHLKAIEIHGVTPHHRRSFAPISKQLVKESFVNN